MVIKLLFMALLASSALSANIRYSELDEEDQLLFRAAYEEPSYEHDEYQETEEPVGKLDLLKDGMWALKSKLKQLKVFDKALAAHLLTTKLQVKQLLGTLKKHHHVEPVYHYQSSPPAYHQYEAGPHYPAAPHYPEAPHYPAAPHYPEAPHYPAAPHYPPAPHYPAAPDHYSPPHAPPQYSPPTPPKYDPPSYASPAPLKYEPPAHYESQSYVPTPPKYESVTHYEPQSYVPPSHKYEPQSHIPPPQKYEPPVHYESQLYAGPKPTKYEPVVSQYPQVHIEGPQYVAPQSSPTYDHDPYYGY